MRTLLELTERAILSPAKQVAPYPILEEVGLDFRRIQVHFLESAKQKCLEDFGNQVEIKLVVSEFVPDFKIPVSMNLHIVGRIGGIGGIGEGGDIDIGVRRKVGFRTS